MIYVKRFLILVGFDTKGLACFYAHISTKINVKSSDFIVMLHVKKVSTCVAEPEAGLHRSLQVD